jgi:hypothetical protein
MRSIRSKAKKQAKSAVNCAAMHYALVMFKAMKSSAGKAWILTTICIDDPASAIPV